MKRLRRIRSKSRNHCFSGSFQELPIRASVARCFIRWTKSCCVSARGSRGAETFVDIALFGQMKLEFLRRFRPFRDSTPSHDHLGDIFASLDAGQFQQCFAAWVASVTEHRPASSPSMEDVAPFLPEEERQGSDPHGLAFAARQRLVLDRSRWRKSRMKSSRFPSSSTCCDRRRHRNN